MCRVPDKDDPKYKDDEEAYDDDLEEMQEKTDALKPKDFPYTFYLMDAGQEMQEKTDALKPKDF